MLIRMVVGMHILVIGLDDSLDLSRDELHCIIQSDKESGQNWSIIHQ